MKFPVICPRCGEIVDVDVTVDGKGEFTVSFPQTCGQRGKQNR